MNIKQVLQEAVDSLPEEASAVFCVINKNSKGARVCVIGNDEDIIKALTASMIRYPHHRDLFEKAWARATEYDIKSK